MTEVADLAARKGAWVLLGVNAGAWLITAGTTRAASRYHEKPPTSGTAPPSDTDLQSNLGPMLVTSRRVVRGWSRAPVPAVVLGCHLALMLFSVLGLTLTLPGPAHWALAAQEICLLASWWSLQVEAFALVRSRWTLLLGGAPRAPAQGAGGPAGALEWLDPGAHCWGWCLGCVCAIVSAWAVLGSSDPRDREAHALGSGVLMMLGTSWVLVLVAMSHVCWCQESTPEMRRDLVFFHFNLVVALGFLWLGSLSRSVPAPDQHDWVAQVMQLHLAAQTGTLSLVMLLCVAPYWLS